MLYTALSCNTWNIKNIDMRMTEKNRTANLERDTPKTITHSFCCERSIRPNDRIVDLSNHLEKDHSSHY